MMMTAWYAVQTKPQQEEQAYRHLLREGFEVFYPHISEWVETKSARRSRLLKRPWLNLYLFVQAEPTELCHVNRATVPSISQLVRSPGGMPYPVPQKHMDRLMSQTDHLGEIHLAVKPKAGFAGIKGDRVRFGEGTALWGLYGEIVRVLGDSEILVDLERGLAGQKRVRSPVGMVAEVQKAG